MANFNTDVNITPDRGLKTTQKPRVLSIAYGDGYEQRIADGINNLPEEWTLSWKNRNIAETNKIIKFFEDLEGVTTFDWYPPGYEISSTTTSAITGKLVDTSQYFTNRYLGTTVTDSGVYDGISDIATVVNVDSPTKLSLSINMFLSSGETYTIYPYKKYICEEWSVTAIVNEHRSITAKFNRKFEP